jgi:hypothetical protein
VLGTGSGPGVVEGKGQTVGAGRPRSEFGFGIRERRACITERALCGVTVAFGQRLRFDKRAFDVSDRREVVSDPDSFFFDAAQVLGQRVAARTQSSDFAFGAFGSGS